MVSWTLVPNPDLKIWQREGAVITHTEIWEILRNALPRGRWVPLDQIYALVELHGELDDEDLLPSTPGGDEPKWKRNVRNVLQYRKGKGQLGWDRVAVRYMLS